MAEAGTKPRVTLCLPVAAGDAAPQATLDAALAQGEAAMTVALSLSGPDEALEGWCAAAAEDPRVAWSLRPDPVDPVEILNHLLFHAGTEYVACLAPGDVPDPAWLGRLLEALAARPGAVLADCDLRGGGRSRRAPARPALAAEAEDPLLRVLTVLVAAPAGWWPRGALRTAALAEAGRIPAGGPEAFAVQLARSGALVRVPEALNRAGSDEAAPDPEAWDATCAAMTEAALALPASAQDLRLLWLAGVARLVRAHGRTPADAETAVAGFLTRMQASEKIDVPFLLDDDWDKIRRWTRGFAWSPRDRDAIVDFGPQPVNAGEAFGAQDGGGSSVWVKTEGRLPPGTRVKLAGRVLETEVTLNTATASVPPDVTGKPGEYPLTLVGPTGAPRTGEARFWVLRASAFGRGVARLVRRMRGVPEPGAVPALPAPETAAGGATAERAGGEPVKAKEDAGA